MTTGTEFEYGVGRARLTAVPDTQQSESNETAEGRALPELGAILKPQTF